MRKGIKRRTFLWGLVGGCAIAGAGILGFWEKGLFTPSGPEITLPLLPYKEDALEPYISQRTVSFHYGKHHKAYVDNANKLAKAAGLENLSLEQIIMETAGSSERKSLFNNAAQVWNHDFYWKSMKPGGSKPDEHLAKMIDASFGSYENFKHEFQRAAVTQFGSGWTWLVLDQGKLKVTKTSNADDPLVHGQTALLTVDVWEHAYYLDYQNRRADYVAAVLDHLLNWEFAASNLPKNV